LQSHFDFSNIVVTVVNQNSGCLLEKGKENFSYARILKVFGKDVGLQKKSFDALEMMKGFYEKWLEV